MLLTRVHKRCSVKHPKEQSFLRGMCVYAVGMCVCVYAISAATCVCQCVNIYLSSFLSNIIQQSITYTQKVLYTIQCAKFVFFENSKLPSAIFWDYRYLHSTQTIFCDWDGGMRVAPKPCSLQRPESIVRLTSYMTLACSVTGEHG